MAMVKKGSKQNVSKQNELNEYQKLEFKEAFNTFDKDRSGTITTKELLTVMRSIGQNPTEDEILNLVVEYDVNGDGTIDFDEFCEMMLKTNKDIDQSVEIREAFKIFDRDGNGYIDAKEFKDVITRMGSCLTAAEAEEFLSEADINQDGKLDYHEFLTMMLSCD